VRSAARDSPVVALLPAPLLFVGEEVVGCFLREGGVEIVVA
jgi:hypothetical protein